MSLLRLPTETVDSIFDFLNGSYPTIYDKADTLNAMYSCKQLYYTGLQYLYRDVIMIEERSKTLSLIEALPKHGRFIQRFRFDQLRSPWYDLIKMTLPLLAQHCPGLRAFFWSHNNPMIPDPVFKSHVSIWEAAELQDIHRPSNVPEDIQKQPLSLLLDSLCTSCPSLESLVLPEDFIREGTIQRVYGKLPRLR